MRLYIIRHAQSTNNALSDPSQRVCDPALTELGLLQAELLAEHLAMGREPRALEQESGGYRFTRLFTSPMRRSIQTARPIGRALGLRPEVWLDIHEHGGIFLDHGPGRGLVGYPGMCREEMLAECAELVLTDRVTSRGWWTAGYEELDRCRARAESVAQVLHQWPNSDEHLAMVTHGGFADILLTILLGPSAGQAMRYHLHNTSVSRLDWNSDGRVEMRYLGCVDHLPSDSIS